jgi:aryl-alcohol dehydrogenase-like predicted oxidoreductase
MPSTTRRDFLTVAGGGAVVAAAACALRAQGQQSIGDRPSLSDQRLRMSGPVPVRRLGRTGAQVSLLGIGGYHLGNATNEAEAVRIVHEAVDHGINFFDCAWEYHDGRSEQWLGRALEGRRNKVFLMTKVCTHGRDRRVAMRQLEDSLRRLRTDHLDLWQIHEVIYDNDPDLHFAPGGVIEAMDTARVQGKVRFIGFTGHKDPSLHLKMLSHGYPFDTVQLPLNCFDATFRSFEREVVPMLERQRVGIIGMKSLGGGRPVQKGAVRVDEALRYAMSLPVSTVVSGIDSIDVLYQNLNIAGGFRPMSEGEMAALRKRCAPLAADGRFELFKTSKFFDGMPGREQHGFPTEEE